MIGDIDVKLDAVAPLLGISETRFSIAALSKFELRIPLVSCPLGGYCVTKWHTF